jgi:hypothetical protein
MLDPITTLANTADICNQIGSLSAEEALLMAKLEILRQRKQALNAALIYELTKPSSVTLLMPQQDEKDKPLGEFPLPIPSEQSKNGVHAG